MASLKQLGQEIEKLKERNRRVEIAKAWETSFTRRLLIFIFTYVSVGAYLWIIQIEDAWLHAIVPAFAFMLSTLTLPYFKRIWTS